MTTNEVAQATGATLRQLQWWDERGYIPVRIVGHRRDWDQRDVRIALILQRLEQRRGRNRNIAQPKSFIRAIQKLTDRQLENRYILTNAHGTPVAITSTPERAIQIAAKAKHPVFLIELPEWKRLS
jgi:DNA-binding transcriptional MerR regulator